jgi:hypothetical protein
VGVGEWIALAELVVAIVGFGLAIWQLRRSADASVATKEAIERTARRMSLNHLLVLLPQLRSIEGDLDAAAATDDRPLAIRSLVSYSHTANAVASLLAGDGDLSDPALIVRLRDSAKSASVAKAALVTGSRQAVKVVVKTALEQIGDVSSYAAGLSAQFQMKAN